MDEALDHAAEFPVPPLKERIPGYLMAFGLGLALTALVGLIWSASTRATLVEGIAYTWQTWGVVLLLVGGATGGGFANISLGATGTLFGGRTMDIEELRTAQDSGQSTVAAGGRRRDPMERLKERLRPEANPTAFWQVIGGVAYIAVGLVFLNLFG